MRLSILLFVLLLLPTCGFAEEPRILFDQGHRQAFLIENEGPLQLSGLAAVFHQQGWQIEVNREPLTGQGLTGIDALVISGAFSPFQPAEIETILHFLQQGGRLAVMIHIGQPILPLMHQLGVDVATRVINETPNQPNGKSIDFTVTSFKPHPLTSGLQQFNIYGGWPLRAFSQLGESIASSSPHSWIDMNQDQHLSQGDIVSQFDVIISGEVGRGSFVVFADDAIFQNKFLKDGNLELAKKPATRKEPGAMSANHRTRTG